MELNVESLRFHVCFVFLNDRFSTFFFFFFGVVFILGFYSYL